MRALKITFFFVVIMAIVVVALLVKWPGSMSGAGSVGVGSPYAALSQRVDSNWADDYGASEIASVYEKCYNMICQASGVSNDDKSEIHEKNIRLALEEVWGVARDEWSESNCSKRIIDDCEKAIKKIGNLGSDYKDYPVEEFMDIISNDDNAKLFRSVNKAYCEALELCEKAAPEVADFNVDTHGWTPFGEHESEINTQITNVKEGACWKYISNISCINVGLKKLEDGLPAAKKLYYEDLVAQVETYYDGIDVSERTTKHYNEMRAIATKIKEQGEENRANALLTYSENFYNSIPHGSGH